MHPAPRLTGLATVLFLVAAACTPAAITQEPTQTTNDQTQGTASETTTATAPTTKAPPSGPCQTSAEVSAWETEVATELEVLQEGDAQTPRVEAVRYPHPQYEGKPWTQWGQGIELADGRFLSAIGDHRGPDGNSYFYVYDPEAGELRLIGDVLGNVEQTPGEFGFGKVHAQMVETPCGEILATTYWGTRRGLTYTDTYRGDILMAIDPSNETIRTVSVVEEERGVPSIATWKEGGLLYAEAADPLVKEKKGEFLAIDLATSTTIFSDGDGLNGFRWIAVDANGRAYYSVGPGKLRVYDPATNSATDVPDSIPGDMLRAATPPDDDGVIYAVTKDPARFFTIEPDGSTQDLGAALDYTTSLAFDQATSTVYSMPGAHGRSWQYGSPIMALDTETGEQSIVVELDALVRKTMGLRVGGTYDIVIDSEGKRLYLGLNVSEQDDDSGFGDVIFAVVTLP